jgi:hypothetical protein
MPKEMMTRKADTVCHRRADETLIAQATSIAL